jgi:hypothetical protein
MRCVYFEHIGPKLLSENFPFARHLLEREYQPRLPISFHLGYLLNVGHLLYENVESLESRDKRCRVCPLELQGASESSQMLPIGQLTFQKDSVPFKTSFCRKSHLRRHKPTTTLGEWPHDKPKH